MLFAAETTGDIPATTPSNNVLAGIMISVVVVILILAVLGFVVFMVLRKKGSRSDAGSKKWAKDKQDNS